MGQATQPEWLWALTTRFPEPPPGERCAPAVTWEQHGDRVETRRLWASSALPGDLTWPGAPQVALGERGCVRQGTRTGTIRVFLTRLGLEVGAAAVLEHSRGHGSSEHRRPWVRDGTLGDEAAQVRGGSAPRVLAALRSPVSALVRTAGWTTIAAARRHSAWPPGAALAVRGLGLPGQSNDPA